ncbi:MAG: hypothetical protein RPR97_10150 [Colwellia sp.]|jgi:hypothetical protein
MAFIDLFACLLTGLAMGGLFYFIVTTGLLQLIGQVDMFTPAAVSVLLFAVALGWKFDYSLTVFLMNSTEEIKGPESAILSIIDKLKYVILVIGYVLG